MWHFPKLPNIIEDFREFLRKIPNDGHYASYVLARNVTALELSGWLNGYYVVVRTLNGHKLCTEGTVVSICLKRLADQ